MSDQNAHPNNVGALAPSNGPLHDVRVLDLSTERAGGVCAKLLADLGADVVRSANVARTTEWDGTGPDAGVFWDAGKRYATIATDQSFSSLLSRCDVVVIDGPPGELAAAGRSPAVLAEAAPSAVICWLPANGVDGPLADLPADPLLLSAISGYAQLQSCTSDTPIAPVIPVPAYVQATLGAAAAVAGLMERCTSGKGQIVSITGLSSTTLLTATLAGEALDHPEVRRPGRDPRTMPSFRPYRARDGRSVFVGALGPSLLMPTLEILGLLELMVMPGVDGEYMNLMVRDNAVKASLAIEERFAQRDAREWMTELAAADVPVALVQSRAEWVVDPFYAGVGGRVSRVHPVHGEVQVPGPTISFSLTPMTVGKFSDPSDAVEAKAVWAEERARTATLMQSTPSPLNGLRVLDLSTYMAGPMGPMVLAQWGADVIKIERPQGDPYLMFNLSYGSMNQGKRAVSLDLRRPDDRAAFDKLVAQADVVLDNLRPSVRARVGLDIDQLLTAFPKLVYTTISAFGDAGPGAERPGFDPVLQAASGIMYESGDENGPYFTSTGIHDIGTGVLSLLGTLAALHARAHVGRGQRVAVALARTTNLVQLEELTDYAGRPPTKRGSMEYVGATPGQRYYRANDGWVAVCAHPDQFDVLLTWARRTEPADVSPSDTIAAAIVARTAETVVAELVALGIAAAGVIEGDGRAADRHLMAHEALHVVTDPVIGRCRINFRIASWSRSTAVEPLTVPAVETEVPAWFGLE